MAEASKEVSTIEDSEVRNIISTGEEKEGADTEETDDEGSNVRDVLEKLSDFLTKNNLEKQITDERKKITRKIEQKNEEISQKNETHRHKLCDIHEAYKIEIQKENERHVEDLKITETAIRQLKIKLEELQQLNYSISRKIPNTDMTASSSARNDQTRVRDLLECPVCLEEMKPPKKIFQCSNGHVICELCKANPEVRSCPTCRVKFRGHNVVRNIVAEKLARSTFETDDLSDLSPPPPATRASTIESNPPLSFRSPDTDQFQLVGFEPAYGYRREQYGTVQHRADEDDEGDDEDDNDFLEWARILGQTESNEATNNQHRRLGEAPAGREDVHGESGGQSNRATPTRSEREYGGTPREPRMREAQLIRTYRPHHPRYLPHHMRRQRNTSQEEPELREIYNEEEAAGERLFFSRTPRTVRRSDDNDNLRGYRRVL